MQSKAKSCDMMRNTPTARNRKETQVTNKKIIQELYQNNDVPPANTADLYINGTVDVRVSEPIDAG